MIKPHGGKLVEMTLKRGARERALAELNEMQKLVVHRDTMLDIGNIATGVFRFKQDMSDN